MRVVAIVRTVTVAAVGLALGLAAPGAAEAAGPAVPFDLNGDGFADLAIGVPGETLSDQRLAGALNVLPGSAAGPTATGNQFWSQDSAGVRGAPEFADLFGDTVASGDFDRDGRADLAVGIPQEAAGSVRSGAVSVLYGSASGLTASRNQFWSQDSPGVPGADDETDAFGSALAAGDFNRDGYADLAVGAPNESFGSAQQAGLVTVLYGSAAGLSATGATAWTQSSAGVLGAAETRDHFGSRLAADDLTGDGYADLVVSVPKENDYGAVQLLRGGAGGLTATGNQIWSQSSAGVLDTGEQLDDFGDALATGDFNQDGVNDLAVGVPGEVLEACDECENQGAVNVLLGTSQGLTATDDQFWHVGSPGVPGDVFGQNAFGRSLAAGDFDGDGAADLAVAAPTATVDGVTSAGLVHLLAGSSEGLLSTNEVISQNTPGVPGNAESGDGTYLTLAAHPYSGGGRDSLTIAYPTEEISGHRGAGAVVVVPASATGLDPAHSQFWTQNSPDVRGTAEESDRFGPVNGDSQVF